MIDADWDVLGRYVRALADDLGLRDWSLILKRDPPSDEAALASVNAIEGRKLATVRVCSEYRELTADEQRQTVVHELLHCHLAEGFHYLSKVLRPALGTAADAVLEAFRLKIEYAVDAIATESANRFPHIEWKTPDPNREDASNAPYEGPIDAGEGT